MRLTRLVAALLALVGCDAPVVTDAGTDAGPTSTATLRFAPSDGPIDFGQVPFPDDLYLGADGRLELGALPGEASAEAPYPDAMRAAAADLDGFGAVSPVFFTIDGAIDATSLPDSPLASVAEAASVFLVDADPASPSAFERVPVEVAFDAVSGLLTLRPWEGHALRSGRSYAAIVTRRVRGMDGLPLTAAPQFALVRDAASRPDGAALAEAWERYQPVLASLGATMAREVVGMAVFRVQTVGADFTDLRAIVRAGATPALTIERAITGSAIDELLGVPEEDLLGLDVIGGVVHDHIGWVIDGRYASPTFTNETEFVHGGFTRDAAGALEVKRTDQVWFTLVLPAGDVSAVRAVVFQHGLGNDRSRLFSIADALCAQGWAVLAIDIPYHGMRAQTDTPATLDLSHAFGPSTGPDLFGDADGGIIYLNFVGAIDLNGPLSPFHPFYVRDVLRQSVVDLMGLVRQIEEGDWSVLAAAGGPETLGFADEPIGFVGVSLGAIVGTMFVTMEPSVGAAVLNVPGGALTQLVAGSPGFRDTFIPIIAPIIGMDFDALDDRGVSLARSPELSLYQTFLDRGDSMTYAPRLAERSIDVLFQMAVDDETVTNPSTEALARSAGAEIVGTARYTDLSEAGYPLSANLAVGASMVTRGLTTFAPATHGLLSSRRGVHTVEHPIRYPFVALETPVPVENDVDGAVGQLVRFFETWRSGAATIDAP